MFFSKKQRDMSLQIVFNRLGMKLKRIRMKGSKTFGIKNVLTIIFGKALFNRLGMKVENLWMKGLKAFGIWSAFKIVFAKFFLNRLG